jgi:predicted nucleotidyltransferase
MNADWEKGVTLKDEQARRRQAQEAAGACVRALKEQFGVREVYQFGSLAGQGPWHGRSDIDLAVEGLEPGAYVRALSTLYQLLPEGIELDLITLEDAPPELAARIRGEAEMPEDQKEALKKEVSDELVGLGRMVDQVKSLLARMPQEPTWVEVNAAGKMAHDFYNGAERIFERIAVRLGPGLPTGEGWHTLLLRGMESGVEGVRPAVIDRALALRLVDYLRFRHLFRHTYGYDLTWDKLRPLAEGMEETLTLLRQQVEGFLKGL